ncbi:MAG TPA: hypothetical protein VLK83_11440 [Rhodanobacteraceae bacterium]|nr:hypothetical protein [Rhodanobacteraceae bacterium]
MKTRTLLIVATLATLIAGSATANTHEAGWSESMTVDAVEPVRATLLPVVSIDATQATSESNPATMRVADTAPIEVTLLPTVRITARMRQELATTLLPTVRVTPDSATIESSTIASDVIAEADGFASDLPVIDDKSPSTVEQPLSLRARAMPR